MSNLTTVTLTNGAGTGGTGTVSTLDNVIGTAGTASPQVQTVQGIASMTALKVDGSAVTQPVSGTVTINAIPTGTNTIGSVKVTDGTNTAAVKAASTSPATTDPAIVVGISPNSAGIITTGTAGSPSAQVLSVQGVANGTTIPVTGADQYGKYNTIAASQTTQVLTGGGGGASGDYLAYVTVFPGTAACGAVTILDNATTVGTFAGGGTTALPTLVPFTIQVGAFSSSGAWKITTGANVTCVAVGKFT